MKKTRIQNLIFVLLIFGMDNTKVLFVCLGNICRSPMAEGAFIHLLNQKGIRKKYEVDSAGTAGYHIGSRPDERMLQTALNHEVDLPSFARKFKAADFEYFDFIIGMDDSNIEDILDLIPSNNVKAKVLKMRKFDTIDINGDVPDPYYGGQAGFENVYEMLMRCNASFIDYLEEN